jgi:hypothetical protein
MKKALTLLLLLNAFGVFSQKKMMARPSFGLTVSPLFHVFEENSSLIIKQNPNYEFGGFLVNKFLLKNNSLDLRIGCNWNNKSYYFSTTGNSIIKSTFTEFTYVNVPILLSFSFDKHLRGRHRKMLAESK